MKFSHALISMACVPSTTVLGMYGFHSGHSPHYDKHVAKAAQETVPDTRRQHSTGKALEESQHFPDVPSDTMSEQSDTETFDQSQNDLEQLDDDKPKCGVKYRPNLIILNGAETKPSQKYLTEIQQRVGEPDHDDDEYADPYVYDARGDANQHKAPHQKPGRHKKPMDKTEQEQKDAEQDDKSKVNYGSDGCVECAAITIQKLADWFQGDSCIARFFKCAAEWATKALLFPIISCGYVCATACDKCMQCSFGEEPCFNGIPFCKWLDVSQEETWVGLGKFCPAMFKCTWFCFKNCAVSTLSCSKRNKIIRCPEKAYKTIKEKWDKMQESRENREPRPATQCYCEQPDDCGECRACNACCAKCDACCFAVKDCMICCCSAAGEMTDWFMCCCHAFVETEAGNVLEAEGCQVFCELVSCCAACPGVSG